MNPNFNPNNVAIFGTGWERLPQGYFLQSVSSTPAIDQTQSLPNIVGGFVVDDQVAGFQSKMFYGAFTVGENIAYDANSELSGSGKAMIFDASNSCNIYQDTTKIKPQSINVIVWLKKSSYSYQTIYKSYNLTTDILKEKLVGSTTNCRTFVERIHSLIGNNNKKYLTQACNFNVKNNFSVTVPAGGYIETFSTPSSNGYKGVWLNRTYGTNAKRYQTGEVYGDGNSGNVTITYGDIFYN